MPAGPVFLYFFFHLNQLVNQHFCCAVDTSIVSKGSEYDRGIFACDECCFTVVFSYAVDQDLACFGYTAATTITSGSTTHANTASALPRYSENS